MNVHMCGLWDATNLWLQWDDVAPEAGYQLQVRFRRPPAENGGGEWQPWSPIERNRPYRKPWIVIPTWKNGSQCQAQVGPAGGALVSAREVTFLRSRCQFSIETTRRTVRYPAGAEFHSIVDGAACHYALGEEVDLVPGQRVDVEMTAAITSGYCQLDYPGHFRTTPTLGLVIENTAASVDDLQETGRDFTVLAALPRQEPLKLVIAQGRNYFNGNA